MGGSGNPMSFGFTFHTGYDGLVCGRFQSHTGLQRYDGYTAAFDLRAWVKSLITPVYYVEAEFLCEQQVMARAKAFDERTPSLGQSRFGISFSRAIDSP